VKIICCPRQEKNTACVKDDVKNISLTIGAEGGFSDREIKSAFSENFMSMSLGPRILRTETATVVAMTLLQARYGDLSPIFAA